MRHLTCDPNAETSGGILQSFIDNLNAGDISDLLDRFGLGVINADRWYPTLNFLELLNALGGSTNMAMNYVAVGIGVAEVAYMPPELATLSFAEFVERWDEHYQANHRNADVGHKFPEKLGENHYQIKLNSVYPDDIEYGVLYGFAQRYLPQGTNFTVWYDSETRHMDQGGEETVIHVQWYRPSE